MIRVPHRTALTAALALALIVLPGAATAQVGPAPVDEQRFRPSLHQDDVLGVVTTRMPEQFDWHVGMMFNYSEGSLAFHWGEAEQEAVQEKLSVDLMASFAPLPFLDIALGVPLHLHNSGQRGLLVDTDGMASAGLGDLRQSIRFRPVDPGIAGGFGLALVLEFIEPTGTGDAYLSDETFMLFPRLVLDYAFPDDVVHVAFNAGYRSRLGETSKLRLTVPDLSVPVAERPAVDVVELGDEVWFALGVDVNVWRQNLDLLLDFEAATGAEDFFDDENSRYLELRGAVRYTMDIGVGFLLGAGGGLAEGIGSPEWRLFAGVAYSPRHVEYDEDSDGVSDEFDHCPQRPEDADMFEDDDGCPDPDNDADGVPDEEDFCPLDPEDRDGSRDGDGCPDLDNDGDGIPDTKDACPNQREDADGFEDGDGCPEPDNDGDGVPDTQDACPLEREVVNGCRDDDGCPDDARVCVDRDRITIGEKIYFRTNRSKIQKQSYDILEAVAQALIENPWIRKVEVGGHTDDRGSAKRNRRLSRRRAEAVVDFLIGRGVARDRLTYMGYGEEQPIAPNDSKEGRSRNRRVEFRILAQDPPPARDGAAPSRPSGNEPGSSTGKTPAGAEETK